MFRCLLVSLLMCSPAFALPNFSIKGPSQHNETPTAFTVELDQTWSILISVNVVIEHIDTVSGDFVSTSLGNVIIPKGQTVGFFTVRPVADGAECQEQYRLKGTSNGNTHNTTHTKIVKLGPVIGDSNNDGVFNSTDLVLIFNAGKYETGNAATWAQGDWNNDGKFNSGDIILAFQCGSYVNGSQAMQDDWEELNE